MEPWEFCMVCPDWELCDQFGECQIDAMEAEEEEEEDESE
jgi:hypothetical protein